MTRSLMLLSAFALSLLAFPKPVSVMPIPECNPCPFVLPIPECNPCPFVN